MPKSLPFRVTYELCFMQEKLLAIYNNCFYSRFFWRQKSIFGHSGHCIWCSPLSSPSLVPTYTFLLSVAKAGGTSQGKLKTWGYYQSREEITLKSLGSQVRAMWQLPLPSYNDGTLPPSWCSCNQFIVNWKRLSQACTWQVICLLLIKTSSHWSGNQAAARVPDRIQVQ